jgi:NAD-dependent dihydropyrimidine dehydrogenase PreA subunit
MRQLRYIKDVTTLKLDEERCISCGMCTEVCPQGVIQLDNGYARIGNRDACMECGACGRNCPTEAFSVQAGVGCAAAVINTMLGRNASACCNLSELPDKETNVE